MEGLAEGSGLPFDAVWLLQNSRETALRADKAPLFTAPLCTMAAAAQPEGGLLVARNLDWTSREAVCDYGVRARDGAALCRWVLGGTRCLHGG